MNKQFLNLSTAGSFIFNFHLECIISTTIVVSFTAKCSRVNIFTVLQAAASLVMGVVFVKFQLFSALLQLTWDFLNVSLELLHWILLTSETYVFLTVGAECLTVASFVTHILSSEAVHLDLGCCCFLLDTQGQDCVANVSP